MSKNSLLFAVLSVAGLSFWFFLGFPFGNHNESYAWIAQLNRMPNSLLSVLRWSPAPTFRPLGIVVAWLGYRLSNGSIYPQQLFNFVVAILAWLVLYWACAQKTLFALVAFLVGGMFFSGYIYLFHLHGVFYSPLLVFIAVLTGNSIRGVSVTVSRLTIVFALAVVVALFHTFALPIYIAFSLGWFLENRRSVSRIQFMLGTLFLALAAILGGFSILTDNPLVSPAWLQGLITSYRLTELRPALSVMSWLLCAVTILGMKTSRRTKVISSLIVTIFSFAFARLDIPVVLLWIAVCVAKTVVLRKWSMAFLIAVTAILPVATATGSPTYSVSVLMVCSAVLAFRWSLPALTSPVLGRLVPPVLILLVAAGVLARSGVRVPVVTEMVSPILAEREKTFQLEHIIAWWKTSDYEGDRLVLYEATQNPAESSDAANRRHRAPTYQLYLDEYTSALRPESAGHSVGRLLVCFGNQRIAGAQPLYTVPGEYSGQATVYRSE